jgi:Fe-S-cluster containining protein
VEQVSVKADKLLNTLCIKCQKCCKVLWFIVHKPDEVEEIQKLINFYQVRGFKTILSNEKFIVEFDQPCPHLTIDGCDIYSNRPEVCRNYDGRADFGNECLWSKIGATRVIYGSK